MPQIDDEAKQMYILGLIEEAVVEAKTSEKFKEDVGKVVFF